MYVLYDGYKKSANTKKLQLKYILIGTIIGFAGGMTSFFLWYKILIPPVGNISLSLGIIAFSYSIIRYRLVDIRSVARTILVNLILAVFTYAVFYGVSWSYGEFFDGVFSNTSIALGIFIVPLFILSLYKLDKGVRYLADKYFFSSLYDYQNALTKLTDELSNYIDVDKIIVLIVETIKETIQPDKVGVFLFNLETIPRKYQIVKTVGFNDNSESLIKDGFLISYLYNRQKLLVSDELLMLARDTEDLVEKDNLLNLYKHMSVVDASIFLPLTNGKRLIGVIVLGSKSSKDAYTEEDLNLLKELSKQAGITIENALQYKAIQDFGKTLKKKVEEKTTDLRLANEDLENKNKLNQELLVMKTDFLRVVNHQLNTPISVMKGYFSMMKEGDYTPEKSFPAIEAGIERLGQTVSDFWDAYELEGERMQMNPARVDITSVVNQLIEEKKGMALAKERNIKISVRKSDFNVPNVWCDIKKITHVISNLLDNAVFYTYRGQVVLFYEIVEDLLKINIRDTGEGISPENKPRLFQKFSRGVGASGMHPDGSGLGLYISKKIVEGNGGEITFASNKELLGDDEQNGTTFSFTIPIYTNQKNGVSDGIVNRENKIEIFN